jgi:hypothetical protein
MWQEERELYTARNFVIFTLQQISRETELWTLRWSKYVAHMGETENIINYGLEKDSKTPLGQPWRERKGRC